MARLPAAVLGTALSAALAVIAAGCAAPEPPAPAPNLPAGPVEVWRAEHGMIGLSAVPAAAPTLRWSVPLGTLAQIDVGDDVVAVAEPVGSGVTVRRLDLASGAPTWSVDVDGDTVVALGLPDLAERWRAPAAIGHDMAAVDSGFVSLVGDEVRAYLS